MNGQWLVIPYSCHVVAKLFFCWSFRTSSFFRQMTHIPPKLIWETTGWIKTLLSYFDILFGNKGMKASFFLFFVHNSIYFSCNILRRQACWWYWDSLSCQSSHIFKRQLLYLVFMAEEKKKNFFKNTKAETTSVFPALWNNLDEERRFMYRIN